MLRKVIDRRNSKWSKFLSAIFFVCSAVSKRFLQKKRISLYEPIEGVKFLTRNIYEKFIIFETWFFNPYIKDFYEIETDDIIVDVGGHLGSFAVLVSQKASAGKVLVYEASKDNFETLVKNVNMNEAVNVIPYHRAVSDKNGDIEFYTSDTITSSGSLYERVVSSKKTRVKSVRLADIIKNNKLEKIDFLKIDVEGAEYEILLSANRELLQKIKYIALEYHDYMDNGRYMQIVNHLRKHQFKVEIHRNLIDIIFRKGHIKATNLNW